MNESVSFINFDKSVKDAAKMMEKGNYGAIPVEKNNKMVGMITDRDIAVRIVAKDKSPSQTRVSDCMTKGIDYCFDEDDVKSVVEKMKTSHHRRIPVVNKDKKLVGIVGLKELATKAKGKGYAQETLEGIYQ
jgi:CBS domain-containing protein